MTTMIAAGKRMWLTLYAAACLIQFSAVGQLMQSWAGHWAENKEKILLLTAINTTITFSTEFVSRTALSKRIKDSEGFSFLVGNGSFWKTINRQSLINVWMTFFASLIAAPVYFFRKRLNRFLFFIGFGVFNSFLSQGIISFLRDGFLYVAGTRILFDLVYNGSVKYFFFEFFRRPIKVNSNIVKLTYIRGKQDLLTSFFKTTILNLLRLKG